MKPIWRKNIIMNKADDKLLSFLFSFMLIISALLGFNSLSRLSATKNEKLSFSIDQLAYVNQSDFVNFSFNISNETVPNSKYFFQQNYSIISNSIMSNQKYYIYSSFEGEIDNLYYGEASFQISSSILTGDLGNCFDFKSIMTNTISSNNKIGISNSLAHKILQKDINESLVNEDYSRLGSLSFFISLNNKLIECSIYNVYDRSSSNSFFNNVLYDDFVVFHERGVTLSTFDYVLASVPHRNTIEYLLESLGSDYELFNVSFSKSGGFSRNVESEILEIYKQCSNTTLFQLFSYTFLTLFLILSCVFLHFKRLFSFSVFFLSFFFIEIIKMYLIKNTTFFVATWLFVPVHFYIGVFAFLVIVYYFMQHKVKHENNQ